MLIIDDRLQVVDCGSFVCWERRPVDRPTLRRVRAAADELGVPGERIRTLLTRQKIDKYYKAARYDQRCANMSKMYVDIEEVRAALADPANWRPRPRVLPLRPMSLNRNVRFAILDRDEFTCRYCGRKPPQVELRVDHVIPASAGGTIDPDNLITACQDCNAGKGPHLLVSSPPSRPASSS